MATRESYTLDADMTPTTDQGARTRHLLRALVVGSTAGRLTRDVYFSVISSYSNWY